MDAKLLKPGPWWDAGTLDPLRHRNLVMQMEKFIALCGLSDHPSYLWEPTPALPGGLNPWLDGVAAKLALPSLILTGHPQTRRDVMARVVGRCLREATDARLRTFSEIVTLKFDGGLLDDRILLIPDFVEPGVTGNEPAIRRAAVLGHVIDRLARGRITVLGAGAITKASWPYSEDALPRVLELTKMVAL